jgi:septum formation protein
MTHQTDAIDIYLASRSPRRQELLRQIGVRFEPLAGRADVGGAIDIDESQLAGESAAAHVERLADEKARNGIMLVARLGLPPHPVLAADTVVIVDGEILGKPADAAQARAFLRRLSGRAHEVRTAIALAVPSDATPRVLHAVSVSTVTFRLLTIDEIDRYVASGDPFDKAGGYGIQSRAGSFVEHLSGSYTGVMGLPLAETTLLLRAAGVAAA